MNSQESSFYTNDVLVEGFDFTIIPDPEPMGDTEDRTGIVSKVGRTVATIMAGGILVFGPLGLSSPPNQVVQINDVVIVRMHAPHSVAHAAIPDVHRDGANRFRKMFRAVPLNDVERLADPDYGL